HSRLGRTEPSYSYHKPSEYDFVKKTQLFHALQSTLTDHDFVMRSISNKTLACFQRNLKALKIPVVHADDVRAGIQRATQLVGCVDFNECIEPELVFCERTHF